MGLPSIILKPSEGMTAVSENAQALSLWQATPIWNVAQSTATL